MDTACTVFDTAIGRCGIAWGPLGILAFQLPEPDDEATLRRMARRGGPLPQATPPAGVQDVIERVQALLEGQSVDLRDVLLDQTGIPDFNRRVYAITREILAGQTRTYGDIATELGDVSLSRAVGQALGANPHAVIMPCHRVLAARGASGGFSAGGGVSTKLRILLIERAEIGSQPGLF
ncbi:methylated-DNA--[protein]-cysteine S-methyltransferase [Piscinibacter gummiphilus]|uniref:Methylated-DNA--[protein]-cysteine S-methyltransferase n=1 Tax=Piscinibacter gummiphilus TaxID=946333 RepID=A0ABZ0CYM2_9BURK|nr:methylated-DNA--[protein]-cysteine S-methyltransferase [Piscinibacter gummiphilus]WOB10036.1 methylated-DNA--[protein]-cysteine S-methyltransferase [Piscinibacter gummiphilus]